jgi:mono/diheme cytochrome c family protein
MKINDKSVLVPVLSFGILLLLLSATLVHQQDPWEVPDSYRNIKNPVVADSASISNGSILYKKHCGSCHGRTGLGDGVRARQIQTYPGDLTSEAYQDQSDGEQFYKSKFGRDEMPSYEMILTDEEIWDIVNYMRTFRK